MRVSLSESLLRIVQIKIWSSLILRRVSNTTAMNSVLTSPEGFKEIKEGRANILFENTNNVFYNNVQEFNRDITIAAITEFAKEQLAKKEIEAAEFFKDDSNIVSIHDEPGRRRAYPGERCEEGITILEALSATGLRSVRMAKEVPGVKQIIANDLSKSAVDAIKRNIEHNEVSDIVTANEDDASIFMYGHKAGRKEQFDVIDIDPYGTASPFLDAAVQAVKPQGLLCVTCTDMAVLAGNTPETCYAKYGAIPLKTKACHEQALRILLASIEQHANRYSRYIEPLLSVSVDFYIRVFVKVHFGQAKVKMSASKKAYIIRCGGCTSYYVQPVAEIRKTDKQGIKHVPGAGPPVGNKCEMCGHQNSVGGPIWAAPMYNTEFVQKLLNSITNFPTRFKTSSRIKGFLTMMLEELQDVPLHYVADEISSVIKCNTPPEANIKSALLNAGYRVSSFHGRKSSIKTDAPPNVIWDIMQACYKLQNRKPEKLKEDSAAYALVHRTPTIENIDFTKRSDAEAESKRKGVVRFPTMPENWGPKARAKDNSDDEMTPSEYLKERSKRFQGKRKAKQEPSSEKKIKEETIGIKNESNDERIIIISD